MTTGNNHERPSFETWGFYPFVLVPFFFFLSVFMMALYVGHAIGILLFGLLSCCFLLFSVAKIVVSEDGISVRRIVLGTSFWDYDEVSFRAGGLILAYGGIYGGWIMPLRWRECVTTIGVFQSKRAYELEKGTIKIYPYLYLLITPLMLFVMGKATEYLKLTIPSWNWALVWASGMTLSVIAYFHDARVQIRIGKLKRGQTSLVIGLIIWLTTFLSALLIYM